VRVNRWLAALAVVALCACGARAQEGASRVVLVELVFKGGQLSLGEVERVAGRARSHHGIPQLAPVFFEVVGAGGEVLYAGEVGEPLPASFYRVDEKGAFVPIPAEMEDPRTVLRIPDLPEAKELVVYRRVSEEAEGGREQLLRVGL
jgi:hypothetical protein